MKLKFYIKNKKKVYTIKESQNKELKDAHYKFLKIRGP
jgi:hypothetical protein